MNQRMNHGLVDVLCQLLIFLNFDAFPNVILVHTCTYVCYQDYFDTWVYIHNTTARVHWCNNDGSQLGQLWPWA